MKLIHCADLHLDSPMESNLPIEKARERRHEILATFSKLVRHADENNANGILIAGDLFDSKRTTKKTEQYVLDLIEAHPGLSFFYLAGNHDSGNAWLSREQLPANLYTFRDQWTSYEFNEVYITGSEDPDPDTLELPEDRLNILLLHGQLKDTATGEKDTLPFRKYQGKHVDYMALGHLHDYRGTVKLDDRGVACYAGCLEGRGFDECGQKGYVLLEVKQNKILHTFVPFARRTLHEVECPMTGCLSHREAEERLMEAVSAIPSCDLVKVILTGELPPNERPDLTALCGRLNEKLYYAKLTDDIRMEIRPEDYAHDVSLKGEFVRRVMASPLTDKEKEQIIVCGIRALGGEELDI